MTAYFGAKHWRPGVLRDLVLLQRGFDITKSQQTPGEIPVYSSSGLSSWHSEPMVQGPGVIIGRKGTLGSVHYSPGDYWPHDTTLWSKSLHNNNPKFVYYALKCLGLERFNVGGANPTLNRNHIHGLSIFIPDRATQDAIVTTLSEYDDLIENNRSRIALLEEAARLLYREWFVHQRFPGHEHVKVVDGVPGGWERRPLSACATFQSGGTPSKSRGEFWQGDVPWISSGELTSMRISTSTHCVTDEAVRAGSRYAEVGTILGVVRGMSLAKQFRLGVVSRRVCFNQDLKAFVPDRGVESLYLFHAIDEQRDRIRQSAGEASHGTKKLETAVLEAVSIPVATPMLRELFTEIVSPMHRQIDVLTEQIGKLARARDIFLPRLMNGEIAV